MNMFKSFKAFMLTSAVAVALVTTAGNAAHALPIPTISLTCTQPLTATSSCVNGFFANGWASGTGYWLYTVSTVPYSNITMTFNTRKSLAGGPTTAIVYYNIGLFDVFVTSFPMTTACTPHTISLPAVCSNQPNLRVKVVMSGATVNGAACYMPADGGFDGI